MRKKQKWYSDSLKISLFHGLLSPVYLLFKKIFKRSIIMIVCPGLDELADSRQYRNTYDYVRCRALGLLAGEIKRKLGDRAYALAEVGVFRGDFAARIQAEFPDKPFFLFDTFAGFPLADKKTDLQMGLSQQEVFAQGEFGSTSVSLVLSKMPRPENCRICQGYFPETVTEEHQKLSWGLVSLDVDLYKPTLEGLKFFYPALAPGGFIMVHDYNNTEFTGVKKALEDFEAETPGLVKMPLPDAAGTIIIGK